MTDTEYKLIPIQNAQSISIHWEFSQSDYDKLVKGHRSNWCVFLRDSVVHICRVGGEEFYRFTLTKTDKGSYKANSLEMYESDDFRGSLHQIGRPEEEIKQRLADIGQLAVEETAGLLKSYFHINIS